MIPPDAETPRHRDTSQPATDTQARDAFAHFSHLLATRKSCRAYLPRQVPADIIRRIVIAAQRTASWCNTQPWRVLITRGEATEHFRQVYSHAAVSEEPHPDFDFPTAYDGVYRKRRSDCAWQLYSSLGLERGDRAATHAQALRNYDFFGAPHVAIVTTDQHLGVYGAVDCGAYVANFLNAATSLGIASIAQASLATYPGVIRRHFHLPDTQRVVCGISFGYPDVHHPANGFLTSRANIDDVLTWSGDEIPSSPFLPAGAPPKER